MLNQYIIIILFVCLYITLLLGPKRRRNDLENITVETLRQAISYHPLYIHEAEVMPDHIHLMLQAPATQSPAQIAKLVKGCSSNSLNK
jgi:putative transposase